MLQIRSPVSLPVMEPWPLYASRTDRGVASVPIGYNEGGMAFVCKSV